ncbi:MAG TPA: S1C family serine protease [Burkholderiaceae bacterium]|nr:S1C family serine protease [Burkholderiaceae bacterium]
MRRWLTLLGVWIAALGTQAAEPGTLEAQSRALERAVSSVVGVQALALEDARSNATLGRWRQGSGVVIAPDGLVLTIGYLILEAEQVQLLLDDGRTLPARVAAYDLATGFGLLQPLAPLRVAPAPLHGGAPVAADEPLMIVSGMPFGQVSAARLVSRRPFSGYWEYRIEGALFTAPPRTDHSGSGLFNARGELLGIGALVVNNAAGAMLGPVPGNMFVPVDLLQPILAELLRSGTTAASRRAWLGINGTELGGRVHVLRVTEDSPAEAAGVRAGDVVVSIDGERVSTLDALWSRLWSGGPPARSVTLEIDREGARHTLVAQTVDRSAHLRRARGI